MKKRLVRRATGVSTSVIALVLLASSAFADIYIPRGSYPAGTQATPVLQGNDYMPQGGDLFVIQSTNDPNLVNYVMQSGGGSKDEDWFKWYFDGRILKDSAGNVLGSGGIFALDHVHTKPTPDNPTGNLDHDNGYQFIDPNEAQAWVQALKGNWDYVSKRLESATFVDMDRANVSMTWDDLVEIGFDCGAAGVQDGKNGTWFDSTIYVSDPATGGLSLSQHSVQQGQRLMITTTARIGAYHATGYHLEALQILDPSGQDVTASLLGPYGSERISGAAPTSHELYANGLLMTAVSGGGPATVPGGPQTWTHTATIDTTNLQPGTYTVNYWVRDWFDRGTPDNSPIHDTFTVTPSGNGGGGNNGGGQSGGGSGSGGSSGSGGNGGGGQCPAPYDSDVQWVNLGNGDQKLVWTHHQPYPIYDSKGNFVGCGDNTTQMSQTYTHTVSNGQISGLSYDPGTPNNMWLPVPSSQWNVYQGANSIWGPLDADHGWTGFETGGPDANQISSNVWDNGQLFHTYGPPIGTQTPTVWVRAGGGFGFRYVWTGSPDAIPTSGTVTFTMTNPDGGSITWTKPLILNTETLYTAGTNLTGLDQPPPPASEVFSCWADIPKGVYKNGQQEETAWSLSNDWQTAYNNGAHISVSITVNTPAGSFTVSAPNVASTFSYPAWWFTRLASDNLLQDMQRWQQSLQLGTIYADPSLGFPPGNQNQ